MHSIEALETPKINRIQKKALHNHTASLLELAHDLGQQCIDNLLDLIWLLLLLLLVVCLLLAGVLLVRAVRGCLVRLIRGHDGLAAGQVDVHPAGVLLSGILETQFAADLLNARLDLLDVACRVVALADDTRVQLVR